MSATIDDATGFPTVASLEALDKAIANLHEAGVILGAHVAWTSFERDPSMGVSGCLLARAFCELREVEKKCEQARARFTIVRIPRVERVE